MNRPEQDIAEPQTESQAEFPNDRVSFSSRVVRKLKLGVLIVAAAYLVIVTVLIVNEPYLVYPGSDESRGNWRPDFPMEEVSFLSKDGTKIVAWYLPRENSDETILLCHGNAENVAQSSAYVGVHLGEYLNADVMVFDYRGFGKSEGRPNEQGVLEDSEAALEFLCDRVSKQPDDVIVLGHSIGGGPAVHLAAKCKCKALVLQRTFSSMTDAAGNQYPWIPVRYLMKNRYPSIEKIKNYSGPVFQSHGNKDRVINIELARDLYAAAPTKAKYFFEVDGMNHFGRLPEEYWAQLNEFVKKIPNN